jgi:hypothetical protein
LAVAAWYLIVGTIGSTSLFAVDNLIDHNGLVLTSPKLYIIYWGSDWKNGFTDATSGLPSITYRAYLEDFLNGVGGGSWLGSQMQYRNASSPQGVLKGVWVDTTNQLPSTPTQGQLEDEVRRAVHTFNNESEYPEAVYLIALPPGHGDTQFAAKGGPACAWHSEAWNQNIFDVKFFPYITLPYMPDVGNGCATNSVNAGFDFSGHGIFDGVSKVVGHEWAETLTDPQPPIPILLSGGWIDVKGAETGDKCNSGGFGNIGAGGDFFAVQRLWSNNDGGCVLAGAPTADQTPASHDFGAVVRYNYGTPQIVQLTNNGDLDLPLVLTYNGTPWYLIGANASDFFVGSNTCGKILHPGASCQVTVNFRPTDFGTRQAILGANIPLGLNNTGNVTPLSGDGISQWAVLDQSTLLFGGAFINPGSSAPAPIPLTLSNQGSDPRLIQRVGLDGPHPSDFSILSDGCSDRTLVPLGSCTVVLSFMPTATGQRQAELQYTDATGGTVFGIPALGTGLGPVAQLSTASLVFDGIKYDSGGRPIGGGIPVSGQVQQAITFTNTGQSPLEVNEVEVTGDFVLDNNDCTQPLQPNDSCVIQVRLMPTHFEFQSGSLLILDNSSDSPHEVELTGSVDAPMASLVSDEVRFGAVPVGSTSAPQTVQLENLEGGAPLNIQSITATGDFTATSDCPAELAIGRCNIMVTMKPTATGPRSGTLLVTDNAPGSPQHIPLAGIGAATSLCVGSAFGEPGERVTVPITLDEGGGVAGFQVDVGFDPSLLNPVGVRLGADTATATGWSVNSALVGFGVLRVLGDSNPPAGLGPGPREVALVEFDISASAPFGPTAAFRPGNCVLSDPNGVQIACNPCPQPGQVVVRPAASFRFGPVNSPVGVDQFDPLPFPASVQALTFSNTLATGYNGTAGMSVGPLCAGTLQPASLAFSSGFGNGAFTIGCCLNPLLPMTRTFLSLQATDSSINISGSSAPFDGVAKADVNADNAINVLDVVRAINLALNLPVSGPPVAPPISFQKWAANMLDQSCAVDAFVNVLDVVRIRNKALGRPPLCPCGAGVTAALPTASLAPTPLTLTVVRQGPKDYLVTVRGAVDLSGLQLELKGIPGRTTVSLEGLAAHAGWQATTGYEDGRLRVVAFSNTATGVTGDSALLRITGGAPQIVTAVASDSLGREIPSRW